MKTSIKPWRQSVEPRVKGHPYASFCEKEEIKEMVGPIQNICSYLFSKRKDRIIGRPALSIIQPTFPFEKSYNGVLHQVLWITKPQSLLSPLQTLIPFPLWLNFGLLWWWRASHVTQVLALEFLINKCCDSSFFLVCSIFGWILILFSVTSANLWSSWAQSWVWSPASMITPPSIRSTFVIWEKISKPWGKKWWIWTTCTKMWRQGLNVQSNNRWSAERKWVGGSVE